MCCSVSTEDTEKWWQDNKHKKRVLVWKVCEVREGKLWGETFSLYEYTPGEHVAKGDKHDRVLKPFCKVTKRLNYTVDPGIHAFTNKKSARVIYGGEPYIPYVKVPFWAKPQDMIAVDNHNRIVFTKATLTKAAYKQALIDGKREDTRIQKNIDKW